MKRHAILWSMLALIGLSIISAFTTANDKTVITEEPTPIQMANFFVSHGHCSLPFTGKVEKLELIAPVREDQGNPIENLELSFEINPKSFMVCSGDDLTAQLHTPGLFVEEGNEKMTFRSTDIYTMGMDWYQINGKLSIKGIEREVKFFISGIRDPKASRPTMLILEGQFDLLNWGIDYDKITSGESDSVPTKWMHINMKIDMC